MLLVLVYDIYSPASSPRCNKEYLVLSCYLRQTERVKGRRQKCLHAHTHTYQNAYYSAITQYTSSRRLDEVHNSVYWWRFLFACYLNINPDLTQDNTHVCERMFCTGTSATEITSEWGAIELARRSRLDPAQPPPLPCEAHSALIHLHLLLIIAAFSSYRYCAVLRCRGQKMSDFEEFEKQLSENRQGNMFSMKYLLSTPCI